MATIKLCPNCEKETPCQKKGKDKDGVQRWLCKECGRSFKDSEHSISSTNVDGEKMTTNKPKRTEIHFNNSLITVIEAPLDENDAKDILKMYISANVQDMEKVEEDDVIKYRFTAPIGTKG